MQGIRPKRWHIYQGGIFPDVKRRERIEAFIKEEEQRKHQKKTRPYDLKGYQL